MIGQATGSGQGWPVGQPETDFGAGQTPDAPEERHQQDRGVGVDLGPTHLGRALGQATATEQAEGDDADGKGQQPEQLDDLCLLNARRSSSLQLSMGRLGYLVRVGSRETGVRNVAEMGALRYNVSTRNSV